MFEDERSDPYPDESVDNSNAYQETLETKKKIAKPPLNLLFNPSLIIKRDIWDINIVALLEMFVRLIDDSDKRDLRLCGVAALTSSMIHRLKVESIFKLQKIAMQRRGVDESQLVMPIVQLKPMEIPYRFEPTYPVSLEDLLGLLENMMIRLTNPKQRNKQLDLYPVDTFDFDQYFIKIEQILQEHEEMILDIITPDGMILFSRLVSSMTSIEAARCFLAVLYLAMKEKVNIQQVDNFDNAGGEDIIVTRIGEKQ
jgi:segregation and condensation protein A